VLLLRGFGVFVPAASSLSRFSNMRRTFSRSAGTTARNAVQWFLFQWFLSYPQNDGNADDEVKYGNSALFMLALLSSRLRARMAILRWRPWRNAILAAQTDHRQNVASLKRAWTYHMGRQTGKASAQTGIALRRLNPPRW